MGGYTSKTPSKIKTIIEEIESLISDNKNISEGEKIQYRGITYEGGAGIESLINQLSFWQNQLDKAEEQYNNGKPANQSWFGRAEGMM